jgi:aspartokinase/homoserine dehydrogenase 1
MQIVMKFGGTSVGDGVRIAHVADIIKSHVGVTGRATVVVSAMSGVTDALVKAATSAAAGDGETFGRTKHQLLQKHLQALGVAVRDEDTWGRLGRTIEAELENFESLCRSIHVLGELTPRALDLVSSLGERFSTQILAATLCARGVPAEALFATELIVTDDNFGDANPLMEPTCQRVRERLLPLLDAGTVPVVTGFMAATRQGLVTTLGRGGSDYSAAIIGSCLDADEIWIWTDVDGVMTADPRIVPDAQTLDEISYAEAAELAYYGARVLHPKTILPAVERDIPVRILNTFRPEYPGTRIVAQPKGNGRTVKAITAIHGMSLVTVEGRGMLGVPGVAAKVFSAVAHENVSVLMISQSSSEQSICFVIPQSASQRAIEALNRVFELELARHNIDRIWSADDVVIVSVVGAGMRGVPGIAGKVFGALGRNGVNIVSIAQGSSEHNLSFVVAAADADAAVRHVHAEFELGQQRNEPPMVVGAAASTGKDYLSEASVIARNLKESGTRR